jgi:hypothetical protein
MEFDFTCFLLRVFIVIIIIILAVPLHAMQALGGEEV